LRQAKIVLKGKFIAMPMFTESQQEREDTYSWAWGSYCFFPESNPEKWWQVFKGREESQLNRNQVLPGPICFL
jgi:hypothetical protein